MKIISSAISIPTFVLSSGSGIVNIYYGKKRYELSDWLGNVRVVVSDKKVQDNVSGAVVLNYKPEVLSIRDYYAFGSEINERTFEPIKPKYRYGFNTQEKVFEINKDHYTARYWEYDSRLGRRWNVDPKPDATISNYSVYNLNPIQFFDIEGDTLDIGNTKQSFLDIISLVREENIKYLIIKDGRVNLNFGDLGESEIKKILSNDEGLNLINDLVTSNKRFFYEASDYTIIRDEGGNEHVYLLYNQKTKIVNASEFGKDSNGKRYFRPKTGYDGQVAIHSQAEFVEYDPSYNLVRKSRKSVVFHELAENYERTHNGIDYQGKNGAHNLAIQRERKWHGCSWRPGEVNTDKVYAPKPSKERLREIYNEINQKK